MHHISYIMVVSLLIPSLAFSGTAIQTDWSGGDGILGPVLDWGDTFYSTDSNLSTIGGMLKLALYLIIPEEHIVYGNFGGAWSVYSADIDGDGDADVLGAASEADDITGRILKSYSGALEAGNHSIGLGDLNQGIYFCRMVAGRYTGSQRFVVIE